MRRKAQFFHAGYGGKPVYVHGYLTDENGSLLFEVINSEPEPRPKPGLYRAADLPGGWMMLMPEPDQEPGSDERLLREARAAGFSVRAES
jgi:hypothetical protein